MHVLVPSHRNTTSEKIKYREGVLNVCLCIEFYTSLRRELYGRCCWDRYAVPPSVQQRTSCGSARCGPSVWSELRQILLSTSCPPIGPPNSLPSHWPDVRLQATTVLRTLTNSTLCSAQCNFQVCSGRLADETDAT